MSSLRPVSCDVVVVGGGISGLYMAETLMRLKKEQDVCLFEKDTRFGGRNYDVRFSQAPNVSISKILIFEHDEFMKIMIRYVGELQMNDL